MLTFARIAAAAVAGSCLLPAARAAEAPPLLARTPAAGDVRLVADGKATDVYVDAGDFRVARIAAGLLADDVERVTGERPKVVSDAAGLAGQAVIVGTLGQSPLVDRLAKDGKLDVSAVRGKWETFVIATVQNPMPGLDRALVVAGSDRRGTAYGALEISEQIGVGPWYWWADVTPARRDALAIAAGTHVVGPPSVKYRGIFINDEDWGLTPWAAKHLDKSLGNVGPRTYERVFELLLRLKANYLWPAMHPVSVEFGQIDENVKLADEWGIVMGASHAEPMNRNNVHWNRENRGPWRYDTNKSGVDAYWEEWAEKRGPYEAVWSVGMRGIHDSGMQGPRDIGEQVKILGDAIEGQRKLIGEHVGPPADVPQAFMPYKEALAQYQAGLKLPDDVTLVWCDDNYGYVRQLSTPAEQKRSGGAGVYYHISYLGVPKPYLWINTTPPAQIWAEMSKAVAYGADRIWVLNVGDIKPGEIGMEFWSKLAWKTDRYGPDAQMTFLREWAARDFPEAGTDDVADVLDEYYRLAFQRKPELMETGIFSVANYNEAQDRLAAYRDLLARTEALAAKVPADKQDAFFETVLYPMRVAVLTNESYLAADLSRLYVRQQRPAANAFAMSTEKAVVRLRSETEDYNQKIAGGKWDGMMTLGGMARTGEYSGWGQEWFMRQPVGATFKPTTDDRLGVAVEGRVTPLIDGKPADADADPTAVDLPLDKARPVGPWKLVKDGSTSVLTVPNGTGNALTPDQATPLNFVVDVPQAGNYALLLRVDCDGPDDDSWFVRVDDLPVVTVNDLGATRGFAWRQAAGDLRLAKGRHRVSIANREDGGKLAAARLTLDPAATLKNPLPDADDDEPADTIPAFTRGLDRPRGVDVYNTADAPLAFTASADRPWITLDKTAGKTDPTDAAAGHVAVGVDWSRVPADAGAKLAGTVTVSAGGKRAILKVAADNLKAAAGTFVENNGVVSIQAEHFAESKPGKDGSAWTAIPGLGRTGPAAVTVLPFTAASVTDPAAVQAGAASLRYDVELSAGGDVTVLAYCLPTYPINAERGLRYAVSFDDELPTIVDFAETGGRTGEGTGEMLRRTARNLAVVKTTHKVAAGRHTLRLWMVDPGVVVDKLVIDAGGLRPSELGPPETRAAE